MSDLLKLTIHKLPQVVVITLHLSWFDALLYLQTYLTWNVLSDPRSRNNGAMVLADVQRRLAKINEPHDW